jgi:hypothetical protein
VTQPKGVSSFELSQVLPSKLEEVLPMVEQLEQLLEDHDIADEL